MEISKMKRLATLALIAAPLSAAALIAPVTVSAQVTSPLGQVTTHLQTVDTMVADFAQPAAAGAR
jgi:hypothetical protein